MASNDQKCLKKLKTCREEVNWEIEEERLHFLNQFYSLIENWYGELPNLRDISRTEEIDWLLTRDIENVCISELTFSTSLLLDFVIRCDYKDQPKVDEYGSPLLRRTTPIHIVARHEYSLLLHYITRDLFKIYDRFDVNYSDESGLTHFHVACKLACYDAVEKFLKFGQDPNCLAQTSVDPPMHLAVAEGHKQIVILLLTSSADSNLANDEGSTSLHEERKTAQVDARDSLGRTPLHLAVLNKNEKLAELLLKRGADPNSADAEGSTPMHIMCRKSKDEEDDDEVDEDDDEVVDVEDNYDFLELFFKINDEIQQSVKVDARDSLGNTPLHWAVSNKKGYDRDVNEKIAKLLLKRGASPNSANSDGLTPLHIICQSYYSEEYNFVKIFFAICDKMHQTVRVDARDKLGRTPLHLALHLGYKKTAETLLRRGANQNLADAKGLTPLHVICKRGDDYEEDYDYDYEEDYDYEVFEDVLANFFKINDKLHQTVLVDAQDKLGNTPLHWAVTRDYWSMMNLLLRRGANSNLADAEGLTPLHIMCKIRDCDSEMAKEFFEINDELDHPVHVNTRNKKGQTPLHLALNCHGQKFIELLLRRGADHNLVDNDGSTPLHIICQRKDGDELLKIFFKFNCKLHEMVDAVDKLGRTPLHRAVASLSPDMVEFLLKSGADVSGFVFPTDAYIVKKNAQQDTLGTVVFHTMSIVESLEKRGYQLDQTTAISIMKTFAKHGLIDKTVDSVVECLCSDEVFTSIAKEKMVDPNLTLYDFLQLPPQKAEKLFTVKQYKDISKFIHHSYRFYQGFILFLCKRVTTRFFQGWAVELFMTLTRYQLPILCCDIIIRQLNLKDLCCVYLAAADPNLD